MDDFAHWLPSHSVDILLQSNQIQAASRRVSTYFFAGFSVPLLRTLLRVLKPGHFVLLLHVPMDQEEAVHCLHTLRNGQTNCDKRVESCRFVVAVRTSHDRTILSRHCLCDNRLVSFQVGNPALLGQLCLTFVLFLYWFYIGLFLNSIQILMQTINQKREELLRVMLSISWKNWVYITNGILNTVWREYVILITPHCLNKLGIIFY